MPSSEDMGATYLFQSCSGLKIGAELIFCTSPETITDKYILHTTQKEHCIRPCHRFCSLPLTESSCLDQPIDGEVSQPHS